MRLPDEPITLSEVGEGFLVADETEPPVPWTLDELRQYLPGWARAGDAALRDAMLQALAAMARMAWAAFSRLLLAQQSPRYAAGKALAEHGRLRQIARQPGESEGAYRWRLLRTIAIITPAAIKGAVDPLVAALLAPLRAIYIEPAVDAAFVSAADDVPWMAWVQGEGADARLWADYPDRQPGTTAGAYVVPVVMTPLFWIGLPMADADPRGDALAALIISEVEARRMFGVPWDLFFDAAIR